ncbi:MAG TPA: putative colanic acid biosynthesis acetyltransferase [Kiritimatiellia bacterium]|nr:putative colanic acid biosynthesis acetyltransferase [Kiritimatiellia bacterium]
MTDSVLSAVRVDRASCPSPHSFANKLGRLLWQTAWILLFRPVPWFWHAPRRGLLRLFGARVGRKVQIMPSVRIWAPWNLALGDHATVSHGVDLYNAARIEIGPHATVSRRAFLCTATHDPDHPNMPLVTAPVRIGAGAWVAAEVYVHPGVTIGADALAGVRAVVLHDVPSGQIVGGNPAKFLRMREVGTR